MIEAYKTARGKYDTRVAPVLGYNVREELVTIKRTPIQIE